MANCSSECIGVGVGDLLTVRMSDSSSSSSDDDDSRASITLNRSTTTATTGSTTGDAAEPNLPTLLELCSRAVGKHCTCAALESHSPPLDEGLLRQVVVVFSVYVLVLLQLLADTDSSAICIHAIARFHAFSVRLEHYSVDSCFSGIFSAH